MKDKKYDFGVYVDMGGMNPAAKVEVTEEGKYYACYIIEPNDMYFSSKKDQGMEMIVRKTRAMMAAKEKFERMYSMILNRN